MKIPLAKLKAILLYFADNTNPRFLGKVKLMKLFYFLDFLHVKKYGAPVTYDRYVHLEHGPIPQSIMNLISLAADEPDNSMIADVVFFERPSGTQMIKMIGQRRFTETDRRYFSDTELEVLDLVCKRYGNKNTKQIEDESHKEAAWRETSTLEEISYSLAAKDKDCFASQEEIELLERVV